MIAHFHYVLVGAIVMCIFAAIYYWYPKVTGRMLNETLGKWHFWLFFIGFHMTFDTMHFVGILGMPRSIYTYEARPGMEHAQHDCLDRRIHPGHRRADLRLEPGLTHTITASVAGNDPWDAWTLEWSTPSPPPDVQLRNRAGGAQPPSAVGSEASKRS